MSEYDIKEHTHRFAIWAAASAEKRGASSNGISLKTVDVKTWIEEVKTLVQCTCLPEKLPEPYEFDEVHRQWRSEIIAASGMPIKDGLAAKLINVYLKVAVVQCDIANSQKVKAVHPPIDRLLLEELKRTHYNIWHGQSVSWSNFDSAEYGAVINKVRDTLGQGVPLWKIERYWQGHR